MDINSSYILKSLFNGKTMVFQVRHMNRTDLMMLVALFAHAMTTSTVIDRDPEKVSIPGQ
jgi:hypothetical protein